MREKLTKKNEQTGFTIIEVVLVLAIAGLIFLIVFLALPQLQKSRRDTQRRADAGRFLSALESYSGNNNGNYPAEFAAQSDMNAFTSAYLTNNGGVFQDPSTGAAYTRVAAEVAPTSAGGLSYGVGSICSGSTATATGSNARNVTVVVWQESGGSYCQDNQ